MPTATLRAALLAGSLCLAGCSGLGAPPRAGSTAPAPTIDREQQALDQRRSLLHHRVLSELGELREGGRASVGGASRSPPGPAGAEELLLFGGANHDVFLGCLCGEESADSVFNLAGEHGSGSALASIRNKRAPFGSRHHDTSACNVAASRPPVLVAASGKSLGLLTLNPRLKRRIQAPSVLDWLGRLCRP